jgi:hypothetical protein
MVSQVLGDLLAKICLRGNEGLSTICSTQQLLRNPILHVPRSLKAVVLQSHSRLAQVCPAPSQAADVEHGKVDIQDIVKGHGLWHRGRDACETGS